MKICLVTPTCSDSALPMGGGERYVEELARALARTHRTRLVSFGPRQVRESPAGGAERIVLRSSTRDPLTPFAWGLREAIRGFDVIHAFQYFTLPTFLALFWGKRRRAATFVTDLGGGGWTPGYQIDQSRWLDGHLPLSRYAAGSLPGRPLPHRVILGGVDLERFRARPRPEHDGSVVFLGRLLPHKGVHHLVEAMPPDRELHVIGPVADSTYLALLRQLAGGKRVQFHHGLGDAEVVRYLQKAMVLVHPTPVDDSGSARANELLGLAVLEGMACGCPVIASRAASLPELFEDGVSGALVAPNAPGEIRARIEAFADDLTTWRAASLQAMQSVEARFTWPLTAERCLAAYRELCAHAPSSRS